VEVTTSAPATILIEEWIDTSSLSTVVANFARVHMLLSIFDGEPEKWIDFLRREGTADERARDLPFAEELGRRAAGDPSLLMRLRTIVREFSALTRG
jgi:hypothetical protein